MVGSPEEQKLDESLPILLETITEAFRGAIDIPQLLRTIESRVIQKERGTSLNELWWSRCVAETMPFGAPLFCAITDPKTYPHLSNLVMNLHFIPLDDVSQEVLLDIWRATPIDQHCLPTNSTRDLALLQELKIYLEECILDKPRRECKRQVDPRSIQLIQDFIDTAKPPKPDSAMGRLLKDLLNYAKRWKLQDIETVSYTHLTLPTTPYV